MNSQIFISPTPIRDDVAPLSPQPEDGADLIFLGRVRATEAERTITHLRYEAYQPMAEREIQRIITVHAAACREVHVVHRIGDIAVGEAAIGVRILSSHRAEAIQFLAHFMNALKSDVPIWKTSSRP